MITGTAHPTMSRSLILLSVLAALAAGCGEKGIDELVEELAYKPEEAGKAAEAKPAYTSRMKAAVELGNRVDERAIAPLIAALGKDPEWPVRRAAAEALGNIADRVAVKAARTVVEHVKKAAAAAETAAKAAKVAAKAPDGSRADATLEAARTLLAEATALHAAAQRARDVTGDEAASGRAYDAATAVFRKARAAEGAAREAAEEAHAVETAIANAKAALAALEQTAQAMSAALESVPPLAAQPDKGREEEGDTEPVSDEDPETTRRNELRARADELLDALAAAESKAADALDEAVEAAEEAMEKALDKAEGEAYAALAEAARARAGEAVPAARAALAPAKEAVDANIAARTSIDPVIAKAAAPLIGALTEDDQWSVRKHAAIALGKMGDTAAVGPLIAALDDTTLAVRAAAAIALGQIGDARAVPPLARAAEDEVALTSVAAIQALARIGGDDALAIVRKAMNDDRDYIRSAARKALGEEEAEDEPPAPEDE